MPSAGGVAGQVETAAGSGGAHAAGAAGLATGGLGNSGIGGALAGAGGSGNAGSGGRTDAGSGGALVAGNHFGGTGVGGSAGSAAGGNSSGGASAACQMIKIEYAAELEKQLLCTPNAGSQCTNRAAAAPGCECRVFIQPADPFAIEHLSNVANGWFDQDCSMPSCPAKCSTAVAGTCQADAKSPLGGRCVSP